MKEILLSQIMELCGAQPRGEYCDICVTGVSTDTRSLVPGEIFVCLSGERFDGHKFLSDAAAKGAAAGLCRKGGSISEAGIPIFEADDTQEALQKMAEEYRRLFNVKVVGITGSAGKTTTKEMTAAVLSARFNVLKNKGNLNNQIGLPLSVLRLEPEHEAAVFEMGMNHFGEISPIAKIAAPDIAVITNIGTAHIENLGSREGILSAKLEILDGLSPGGILVLNGDDPMLAPLKGKLGFDVMLAGMSGKDNDVQAADIRRSVNATSFTVRYGETVFTVNLPAVGMHNVQNALMAAAVGFACGLMPEEISEGLSRFENAAMRQRIFDRNGLTIIDDCYNANPDSMAAALRVLGEIANGRRIAVLGSMLELGGEAEKLHAEVGERAAEQADILIAYGVGAEWMANGARNAGMSADCIMIAVSHEDIVKKLEVKKGDTLLFKGSRGMKMEEALRLFMEEV